MELPPLEFESVHDGEWLSWDALTDLIPLQAEHYYERFKHLFIGDEQDLAQAAHLALLGLKIDLGGADRVRELPALALLHNAMLGEIKANRRQANRRVDKLPASDHQLNDKQIEMLKLWRIEAAKAAETPYWEIVWLAKCLEWTNQQIAQYISRKTRTYYNSDTISNMIKRGIARIKARIDPNLNIDIRLLHFYK